MVTMLICSVSFATVMPSVMPSVMPVATFDVVSVADMHPTGLNIAVGAQIKPTNDSIADIGAGLFKYAMTTDGSGMNETHCMATCNHKTTDNVTAYLAKPNEVGWR